MHAHIFRTWEEEVTGGMFDEAKQRTQIKLFPLWPKEVHCLTRWGQSFYEALMAGSDREEHIGIRRCRDDISVLWIIISFLALSGAQGMLNSVLFLCEQ